MSEQIEQLSDYPNKVLQALLDLSANGQVVSREMLADVTGLKMSDITKYTKLLVEHGKIYRVTRGIFAPVLEYRETRPVSVSMLPDGVCVLEVGDDVLHLNPQEARTLGLMMSGMGQAFASMQLGRETAVLRGMMERVLAKKGGIDE